MFPNDLNSINNIELQFLSSGYLRAESDNNNKTSPEFSKVNKSIYFYSKKKLDCFKVIENFSQQNLIN